MARSRKKSGVLYGVTRKQVQQIIRCLESGCSDDELAMRIRQIRIPYETWSAAVPEQYIPRILEVKATHGGRKIEASVR